MKHSLTFLCKLDFLKGKNRLRLSLTTCSLCESYWNMKKAKACYSSQATGKGLFSFLKQEKVDGCWHFNISMPNHVTFSLERDGYNQQVPTPLSPQSTGDISAHERSMPCHTAGSI